MPIFKPKIFLYPKPNGTKKKPSAQREHKNLESNAAHNAASDASTENNAKFNSTVTQQQTINKQVTSHPVQQSAAVLQVRIFRTFIDIFNLIHVINFFI